MKKFIRSVQALGRKAEEFKAAMERVPPKVAEFKQAMAMTTVQLKDIRSLVHESVADLKTDNEDRLVYSLHEINGSSEVFHQAGYELSEVTMELSPSHRIIVHLDRIEDVPDRVLRSLLAVNQSKKTTHALLQALIQAEHMADQVDFKDLVYYRLLINVGPIPSVKLCWKKEEEPPTEETESPSSSLKSAQPKDSAASGYGYGSGSFFSQRYEYSPSKPSPSKVSEVENVSSAEAEPTKHNLPKAQPTESKPTSPATPTDPLSKFKKMPDLSKPKR